jgi:hypothetical protein
MPLDDFKTPKFSRRSALKAGFGITLAAQVALLEQVAFTPNRAVAATGSAGPAATTLPAIQFDIGNFINPPQTLSNGAGNVIAQFGPVMTYFVPATLSRVPSHSDQTVLANALNTIESHFAFSPSGVISLVSYGVPYFNLLPGGINGSLVQAHMPQLRTGRNPDGTTNAFAEAVPMPTDVINGLVGGAGAPVPNVTKDRFNVNVVIERNHMLFQFRSDSVSNLNNVLAWLKGSNTLNGSSVPSPAFNGLINFGITRVQFVQTGLPRSMANANSFEYTPRMNPNSPMWMGFLDQQVNAAGPAAICTFAGNSSAQFTNAATGDYFGLGSVQHLSHNIEDLFQFYATPNQDSRHSDGEPATERIMYMFRSNTIGTQTGLPAPTNTDEFTNGGCPAFVGNAFQGTNDALLNVTNAGGQFNPNSPPATQQTQSFSGEPRIGHISALQRSSRAADGTPIHIRADGPGLSSLDVPAFQTFPGGSNVAAGSLQPKLEFTIYMPTAESFRQMRVNAAAQDLQSTHPKLDPDDNGLERFITATRRQNFLVPPRAVRAFPLVELT